MLQVIAEKTNFLLQKSANDFLSMWIPDEHMIFSSMC